MPEITDPTSRLLAARIRTYRTETMGWSLVDLSNRMDPPGVQLAPALLGRIENCTRAVSLPELHSIAAALGFTVEWLMRSGELCTTCGQEITR